MPFNKPAGRGAGSLKLKSSSPKWWLLRISSPAQEHSAQREALQPVPTIGASSARPTSGRTGARQFGFVNCQTNVFWRAAATGVVIKELTLWIYLCRNQFGSEGRRRER
jgi:hypothetical protein